jgi:queuosine precursor transporter
MKKAAHYKYLTFIIMLYMTIKLATLLLIYKIISIGPFIATASAVVIPVWFVLGDIITEVYGYKVARQLIWAAVICQFIFVLICFSLTSLHTPLGSWGSQDTYNQIMGKLPKVAIASFLSIISGAFINAYSISKWKILIKGKYFWLRCLGASAIGELVFTIVAYTIEFYGATSMAELFQLMTISYVVKLLLNSILIIPAAIVVAFLKHSEGIDPYDNEIDFNPFKIALADSMDGNMQPTVFPVKS